MKVMKLGEEYFESVMRLDEYAFQFQVPEQEVHEELKKMTNHHLYGILKEGQLAAKLHLLPFHIYIGDQKIKMGGIAGVATYPEFRRSGFVRALITKALEDMRANGYSVSMLHPFYVDFYRKFGFELFANRVTSTFKKSDLKMLKQVPGVIKRFSKEEHSDVIESIYERYAQRYAGMLERNSQRWFEAVYHQDTAAIYFNNSGTPTGYLLYSIKEKKMTVSEFVPLNQEARHGLWNFICQHDSMVEGLVLRSHENEPLTFLLPEPRVKTEVTPYFMARIVDVATFLNQYPFTWENWHRPIALKVSDTYAPWNNTTVLINKERISVLDDQAIEKNEESIINLSINTLSTALFGYKRARDLFQMGLIQGEEGAINQLEALIGSRQPQILDFF